MEAKSTTPIDVPNVVALTEKSRAKWKEGAKRFTFKDAEEEPKAKVKPKIEIDISEIKMERPGAPPNLSEVKFAKTIQYLEKLNLEFSYDLFRKRYRVGNEEFEEKVGDAIENKILVLRSAIMYQFGFDPNQHTKPAVFRLCLKHAFNPVLDYLDSLKWDRKPRLDKWLITYLGAADSLLNRAFGRKVLIAAVRRARKPGTKFDPMLVLEGPQDIGKSSAVRILAGDYFRDEEIISKTNKEAQELTCGVWLYEMSELVGLTKRDVEHVKNFLSRTHDSARGAYGLLLSDQPRTCVFIGTCNRNDYLTDDTGNRRFWPVSVSIIDLDALERDRDQLWAEANEAEATGEALTLSKELRREAAILADSRLADDPWDQKLAEVEKTAVCIYGRFNREFGETRASSDYLLRDVLDLNPNNVSGAASKRLGACMRRLGWTGPKTMKINGQDVKGYCRSLQALHDWK
jgi:predicted P-loop ATPase